MSLPNIRKGLAQDRQRFWGPSSPNPWTNALFVGPPNRRPVDGKSHRRGREEKRQHSAAINTWEDEGGSIATAIANPGEH
ncbi:MAG TPA: hypothetical protein VFO36_03025 [Nitrospiraceae bacterium]|nr:hypothetical protein [Nitrospiraceae bacterium]